MLPSTRWDDLEDREQVPSEAHAFGGERQCQRYCNAMRSCGDAGPLCRYCARVDAFMSFVAEWMRVR